MQRTVLLAIAGLVLLTGPAFAAPGWKARRAAREQFVRGLFELGRDDSVAAEGAFAEALTLDPETPDARYLLGLTRLALDRPLEALADLETAAAGIESPPRAVLLARARGLRALDRLDEAFELEKTAAGIPVESVEDHLCLSWLVLERGVERLRGARGAAIAAIAAHERKNPFLGRFTLSCVERRLGGSVGAMAQAEIAVKLPGAGAWALMHLADLWRERGSRAEEAQVLERVVLLDGEHVEARERLAALAVARGEMNEAHDRLNALCALPDPSPGSFWLRAWVKLRFGQPEAAIEDLARALASRPGAGVPGGVDPSDRRLRPEAWRRIAEATARIEAGDLEIVPDLYLRMRGRALLEAGRYEEALRDLEKAAEVAPEQAAALRDEILRARLDADPAKAGTEVEALLPRSLGDERIELGDTAVRSRLVRGDWPGVLETTRRLGGWLASRTRDRIAQGLEPGSRLRRDLAHRADLCRLLEARALIAAGRPREAVEILEAAGSSFRTEVVATLAYLVEEKRGERLAEVARTYDPTRLMDRGRDHPLNGWAARFAAEAAARAGDEAASAAWFSAAVREALPAWSEEIVEPGD